MSLMINSQINAAPTLLESISQQITNAGGDGFTSDTEVSEIDDSYACVYRFKTANGFKSLRTRNEYQVGMISDGKRFFVMYNGDSGEYTLVTRIDTERYPKRMLLISHLGNSYVDAQEALKSRWPKRIVWQLSAPIKSLHPT